MKTVKQQGFTLIELIIVIVILGILAVTAAPRFLNLQGDANASVIQGVAGAMNSGKDIVYGKAIIAGVQATASSAVDADGDGTDDITTAFGYPTADAAGIVEALEIDLTNFSVTTLAGPPAVYIIGASGSAAPAAVVASNGTGGETNDGCYVAYTAATDANTPATVTVNTDDCN
ncbi:prepilin-type N-terminal cleavage/methylation domain-containing protein [Pseudoalteromonas sp. SSDWG2]|uniref:prepilin-type N-terminal cleavage/methylation domain-containing protein n=1 Tax=Pseudoalteromonas sp. SSDWG2 TaxID=3139391 RepID=UPI003BA87A5D